MSSPAGHDVARGWTRKHAVRRKDGRRLRRVQRWKRHRLTQFVAIGSCDELDVIMGTSSNATFGIRLSVTSVTQLSP